MDTDFTPEEWEQIKDFFSQALECKPSEHDELLSATSISDRVRSEVFRLLSEYESLLTPMADPPFLKRYTDLTLIGTGMSRVYKARDRETGAVVAVKVLQPEIARQSEWLDRFRTEVRLAQQITHKNVCRVHHLIRDEGVVAITMEYVDGESLANLLRRFHGVGIPQGLNISRQIAAGLAEAHTQGVIHRDLKPANILIAEDGTVKVADFGIARSSSASPTHTQSGSRIGTPVYMSPEQALGKPADARSDIYSLGLVLYELFCGKRAFQGETVDEVLMKQIHEIPKQPIEIDPYLPPFINRIILKCIEKDPSKRFQSAAALESALAEREELDTVAGEAAAQTPLPVQLARWQRVDWLLVGLAVLSMAFFFPISRTTNIASRMRVQREPAVLERIAAEFAQKLRAPVNGQPAILAVSHSDRYDYLTSRVGTRAAIDMLDNPVPYMVWQVRWNDGTVFHLSNNGSPLSFNRQVAGKLESISNEEGAQIAAAAVRDLLGADPNALHRESSGNLVWEGQSATSYTWSDPKDYHGLSRRYVVHLIGRDVASLDSDFSVPPGFVSPTLARQFAGYIVMLVVLFGVGIVQRGQVHLRSRWRVVLAILSSIMIGRLFWVATERWGSPLNLTLGIFLHTAVGWSLIMFFILVALERAIHKIGPYKLITVNRLFGREVTSEACGLAILRGTLIGLAVLGTDTLLVWLATRYLKMSMNSAMLTLTEVYLNTPWAGVQRTLFAVLLAPILAAYFGWFGSVALRMAKRKWVSIILGTAFVVVVFPIYHILPTASLLQPTLPKMGVLFFEILIVMWGFVRFDFLTLMVSLITFLFCSGSYFSLQLLQTVGAPQETAVLAVWVLVVCAAAVIAFQSQIGALYNRLRLELQ